MTSALAVFFGGGLGAILRYLFALMIPFPKEGFPFPTFAANLVSSFILGCLIGYSLQHELSQNSKLLFMTGLCGGFSTFSTFSAETYSLMINDQIPLALTYVLTSIVSCVLIIGLGIYLFK